ncbi:MAG: hypothetical protein D6796_05615 [Caldilineae bacterium]|nr:MAG: hypothetical protein D6796_05615 [Caldilineae bacterium]
MRAIEFRTRVKDGMIEIPSQYRDTLEDVVRVIILADEKEPVENLIDRLLASPLKLKNFKPLSRAEIYERP